MTRRYVVLSDCSNYGDGISQYEADRIAAAEAAAIRRCFPDVLVSIERSTGPAPANDEDVDRWHEEMWEQILMVDGAEANYVDSVVEKWNGVQP